MKRTLVAILCLVTLKLSAQNTTTVSPSAEEIVDNYSKALGGLDNFLKISTAKFTGVVQANGMDLPLIMYVVNGKSMRAEVEAMGQKLVQVFHEGKGWKIDPFNGTGDVTEVEGTELAGFRAQTVLASSLMNYKNLDNTISLAGEETLNGVKHYKVKMVNKEDGTIIHYFINSTNYLLTKTTGVRQLMGQEIEVETNYSDLKEIEGVKMFMSRSQQAEGQTFQTINFTKVELNVPIDNKIFDK